VDGELEVAVQPQPRRRAGAAVRHGSRAARVEEEDEDRRAL
jgi:hypothetical protein